MQQRVPTSRLAPVHTDAVLCKNVASEHGLNARRLGPGAWSCSPPGCSAKKPTTSHPPVCWYLDASRSLNTSLVSSARKRPWIRLSCSEGRKEGRNQYALAVD